MEKKCFKCNLVKDISLFYKHPDMPDGHVNKCIDCNKQDVRKNWHDNIEVKRAYDTQRYRYSISRIFNHKYSGIKTRCLVGQSGGRKCFVTGKKFMSRQMFIDWCYEEENYKKFMELYNRWVQSGFDEKLAPSVDRINSQKSYIKGNLQWLSKSDNCKKYNK